MLALFLVRDGTLQEKSQAIDPIRKLASISSSCLDSVPGHVYVMASFYLEATYSLTLAVLRLYGQDGNELVSDL